MNFDDVRAKLRDVILDRPVEDTPIHHLQDGLFFVRLKGGRVGICHGDKLSIVGPSEWATVVAHCSLMGDTGLQHARAWELHQRLYVVPDGEEATVKEPHAG